MKYALKRLLILTMLTGSTSCTLFTVTGAAVGGAVAVTGAAVKTTGAAVGAVIPDADEEEDEDDD